MKKIFRPIFKLFSLIGLGLDKIIITPLTKIIYKFTTTSGKIGSNFESWLSKSTTLLFVSLFLASGIFIAVDQKIITYSESSAEVLENQPVKAIYNEESYVVEGLPSVVDVTLIGSRANLYFAANSPTHDITVDLSGLKPGTHKVNITYNQVLPSIDYKVNPSVATVIIYPKISETRILTVDELNKDALSTELVIKKVDVGKDRVVIKGAEYQLEKVATVKALVDIKNIAKQEVGTQTLKDVPLKAYDEEGNVVDVEILPAKLDAEIEIASPNKELPIKIIPKGEMAFGWAIESITASETKTKIFGDEEELKDLEFVPVEVDVSGLKDDGEFKLEIENPVGVTSMTIKSITVNITVAQSVDKEFKNIVIDHRNLSEGLAVQGLSANDTQVTVIAKGASSVLEQLTAEDINAYLDLSGYEAGEYEVEVLVAGTDVKASYVSKTRKVKIKIVESN